MAGRNHRANHNTRPKQNHGLRRKAYWIDDPEEVDMRLTPITGPFALGPADTAGRTELIVVTTPTHNGRSKKKKKFYIPWCKANAIQMQAVADEIFGGSMWTMGDK